LLWGSRRKSSPLAAIRDDRRRWTGDSGHVRFIVRMDSRAARALLPPGPIPSSHPAIISARAKIE
jgi:hypothetical protein